MRMKEKRFPNKTHKVTGKKPAKSSRKAVKPELPQIACLDDAAAQLVQLDSSNIAELLHVRDALNAMVANSGARTAGLSMIEEAARTIDGVLKVRGPNSEELLLAAGQLIEKAMYAQEEAEMKLAPSAESNSHLEPEPGLELNEFSESVMNQPVDSISEHEGKQGMNELSSVIEMQAPEPMTDLADEPLDDQSDDLVSEHFEKAVSRQIEGPSYGEAEGFGATPKESDNATEPEGRAAAAEPEPARAPQPVYVMPSDVDMELMGEFVTESRECIEGAEAALLRLETDPDNSEAINTVFRAFHTIKGTSGFLGIPAVSELAHHAESLLSRIREHEIQCKGGYADLALRSADMLKKLGQGVQDVLKGSQAFLPSDYYELLKILAKPEAAGISADEDAGSRLRLRVGDILVAGGRSVREQVEAAEGAKGENPIGMALVKANAASVKDVAEALRTQQRIAGLEKAPESSMRVRTDRLDRLIDMIGELVIAQSMIAQDKIVMAGNHHDLLKKVTHTGKIVRELHDLSMSIRMVPLKAAFQKMARLVRDLAHKSGKAINFVSVGEETEIDRNMVDVIADPLVHMVRNAVDHGIEYPEIREQNGKPRMGTVRLSAYHSGGNVVVVLTDDGKGLDRDKIVAKAIDKGLIESDMGLSDGEVFNLIFAPGFSTADKITEVSGRGVGMDVVRRNVEALRGHVEISSVPGQGCAFTLRLPLTLAITDGMLVRVGPERYIVPTISIHLSFRPDAKSLNTIAGRGEIVLLRGKLIPIIRLHRLFGVQGAIEDATNGLLVVVGDEERRCALLVDELLGQQQVVAKTLGKGIGKIRGVSGGAILGDGRIGLILDPPEIVALARGVDGAIQGVGCESAA
jgi:two-component system chemotaxis sensor kinase CheA